jgi:hypothetical protein
MRIDLRRVFALAFLALSYTVPAAARVTIFSIDHHQVFAAGASWGKVGPYEKLTGTAFLEVDPRDPLNAGIVDLDKAARNARGMVEFSTQFFILKPVDMARSNHKIFYAINNRGNNLGIDFAHQLLRAQTVADVGDNDILLQAGYTIVDAGWEGDLVPAFAADGTPTRLVASVPTAFQPDGSAITGIMRVEYSDRSIPLAGTFTLNLEGSNGFRSYEPVDTNTAHAVLTVRDDVSAPKRAIASSRWAYGKCLAGQASLVPTTTDICYFDGFKNDKLYELIYTAKNPTVMALGYATTRDVGSFLRYEARDDAGTANPLGAGIRRSYATGASQTGGYLRDFMYMGFNEDESHRKVFDGIIPTIAGTDRSFLNVRFTDPNVWSNQDDRHDLLQNSYGVFTYGVHTDPISGIRDGILKRPATDPLVFQIDSETEIWQLRGGLNVADGAGQPVAVPDNVRLYFVSSTAHGFNAGGLRLNAPGSSALCANGTPAQTTESMRAAVIAMDLWADAGIEPPRSNYPRLENGTLVTVGEAGRRFPDVPGFDFPRVQNELPQWNYGPLFSVVGGIITLQPPLFSGHYQQYVPRPDRDGLNLAGIRPLQIRAPLGTSTGWNLRAPGHRPGNLCGLTGSYVPFATTKAERQATGDPRRSLQERYCTHDGFVKAVSKAAANLVRERFLLPADAARFVASAQASNVLAGVTPAGCGGDDGQGNDD